MTASNQDSRHADEQQRERDRLFQRTLHEDNIFNHRLNLFLLFESVLLASGATLFAANDRPGPWMFMALAVFGIAITWIWRYAQERQLVLLRALVDELETFATEVVKVRRAARGETDRGIRAGTLLAAWIPSVALLLWLFILAVAVIASFRD